MRDDIDVDMGDDEGDNGNELTSTPIAKRKADESPVGRRTKVPRLSFASQPAGMSTGAIAGPSRTQATSSVLPRVPSATQPARLPPPRPRPQPQPHMTSGNSSSDSLDLRGTLSQALQKSNAKEKEKEKEKAKQSARPLFETARKRTSGPSKRVSNASLLQVAQTGDSDSLARTRIRSKKKQRRINVDEITARSRPLNTAKNRASGAGVGAKEVIELTSSSSETARRRGVGASGVGTGARKVSANKEDPIVISSGSEQEGPVSSSRPPARAPASSSRAPGSSSQAPVSRTTKPPSSTQRTRAPPPPDAEVISLSDSDNEVPPGPPRPKEQPVPPPPRVVPQSRPFSASTTGVPAPRPTPSEPPRGPRPDEDDDQHDPEPTFEAPPDDDLFGNFDFDGGGVNADLDPDLGQDLDAGMGMEPQGGGASPGIALSAGIGAAPATTTTAIAPTLQPRPGSDSFLTAGAPGFGFGGASALLRDVPHCPVVGEEARGEAGGEAEEEEEDLFDSFINLSPEGGEDPGTGLEGGREHEEGEILAGVSAQLMLQPLTQTQTAPDDSADADMATLHPPLPAAPASYLSTPEEGQIIDPIPATSDADVTMEPADGGLEDEVEIEAELDPNDLIPTPSPPPTSSGEASGVVSQGGNTTTTGTVIPPPRIKLGLTPTIPDLSQSLPSPSWALAPGLASSSTLVASSSHGTALRPRTRTLAKPDISLYDSVRFKRPPTESRENPFYSRAFSRLSGLKKGGAAVDGEGTLVGFGGGGEGKTGSGGAGLDVPLAVEASATLALALGEGREDGDVEMAVAVPSQADPEPEPEPEPEANSSPPSSFYAPAPPSFAPTAKTQSPEPASAPHLQASLTTLDSQLPAPAPALTPTPLSTTHSPAIAPQSLVQEPLPPTQTPQPQLAPPTPPAEPAPTPGRPFIAPPRVPRPQTPTSLIDAINEVRREHLSRTNVRGGGREKSGSGSPRLGRVRSLVDLSTEEEGVMEKEKEKGQGENESIAAESSAPQRVPTPSQQAPRPLARSPSLDNLRSLRSLHVKRALPLPPSRLHQSTTSLLNSSPSSKPPRAHADNSDTQSSGSGSRATPPSTSSVSSTAGKSPTTSRRHHPLAPFEAFISPVHPKSADRDKEKGKEKEREDEEATSPTVRRVNGLGSQSQRWKSSQNRRQSAVDPFEACIVKVAPPMALPAAASPDPPQVDKASLPELKVMESAPAEPKASAPIPAVPRPQPATSRPRFTAKKTTGRLPRPHRSRLSGPSSEASSPSSVIPALHHGSLEYPTSVEDDAMQVDAPPSTSSSATPALIPALISEARPKGPATSKPGETRRNSARARRTEDGGDDSDQLLELASVHLSQEEVDVADAFQPMLAEGTVNGRLNDAPDVVMDIASEVHEISRATRRVSLVTPGQENEIVSESEVSWDAGNDLVEASTSPQTGSASPNLILPPGDDEASPLSTEPPAPEDLFATSLFLRDQLLANAIDGRRLRTGRRRRLYVESDSEAEMDEKECTALLTNSDGAESEPEGPRSGVEPARSANTSRTASSGSVSRPLRQSSSRRRSASKGASSVSPSDMVVTTGGRVPGKTNDVSARPFTSEYPVLTWASYVAAARGRKPEYKLAKNIPHSLQDRMNALPIEYRNSDFARNVFESSIREAMDGIESDSPRIEIFDNGLGEETTPPWEFAYTNEMWLSDNVPPPNIKDLKSCGCVGRCDPKSKTCACARRQQSWLQYYIKKRIIDPTWPGSPFVYDSKGQLQLFGLPIFECNQFCGCDDDCANRVVQNGRKWPVHIAKTVNKGWGVFAGAKKIPKGSYLGIYAGELLTEAEGDERGRYYDLFGRTYLFSVDFHHLKLEFEDEDEWDNLYVVDAYHAGNFTRFLNHSCDPNCTIVACHINDADVNKPLLTIFTIRDVDPWEELCFSYYGDVNEKRETIEQARAVGEATSAREAAVYATCRCESDNCIGSLFT